MFQIIDNLVSEGFAGRLENMCKTEVFWCFDQTTSGIDEKKSSKYNVPGANYDGPQYGFGHWALEPNGSTSILFDKVLPLLYALEEKAKITIKEIYRIRIGLTTTVGKEVQHLPHVDLKQPHKVLLYYVNDSDGDTFLFNEKVTPFVEGVEYPDSFSLMDSFSPKKGSAIIFNGLHYHSSSTPVDHDSRIAININLVPLDEKHGPAV